MAKPKRATDRIERAFDALHGLVSDAFDEAASQHALVKKTGGSRIRGGKQRQAATKKVGAARIREGRQRQLATKKTVRARRATSS